MSDRAVMTMVARRYGRGISGGMAGAIGRFALVLATGLSLLPHAVPLHAQQPERRGWIGVKMWCEEGCQREQDGAVVWEFTHPPVITEVMPGSPADLAGLQAGDTVLRVNGLELSSGEGARRLGMLMAGQAIELQVRRAGGERRLQVMPAPFGQVFDGPVVARGIDEWESLRNELRLLYEEQLQLAHALRKAEQLWQMTHDERLRELADSQRTVSAVFRIQIDSVRRELVAAQRRLADSLAARTLYIAPATPDTGGLAEHAPAPEPRPGVQRSPVIAMRSYVNAVAGARFEELRSGLAAFVGVDRGLFVLEVADGTPAAAAGLHAGDVIVSVNGSAVSTVSGLRRTLRSAREVELEIVRKGERQTLSMRSP